MQPLTIRTAIVFLVLATSTALGITFAPMIPAVREHPDLAGALIGAAGTIFAGWLAWAGIKQQRQQQLDDRAIAQAEAKEIVRVALTTTIHICSVVSRNINNAIAANSSTQITADAILDRSIAILESTASRFPENQLAGELEGVDRARLLAICATIQSFLSMCRLPPVTSHREEVLGQKRVIMDLLKGQLPAFDVRLEKTFIG